SFDFVWSWGVIHHSSNTRKILEEINRVLKPGGKAVIMVYHRNLWNYYIAGGLFHGIFQGELFKTKSLHKTMQHYTDGAIARYYTIPEWKKLVSDLFSVEKVNIFGSKADVVTLPAGKLKNIVMRMVPDSFSRFLTNNLKLGSFLVSELKK
ncbi:MAG: methyltransferase domain-containing protein, partial [Candidatus Omnitrophota bacterium]